MHLKRFALDHKNVTESDKISLRLFIPEEREMFKGEDKRCEWKKALKSLWKTKNSLSKID